MKARPLLWQRKPLPPGGSSSTLLRRALQADGVFCTLSGLLLIADAGPIAALIGVSQPWILTVLGVDLLIYAALLFLAARRTPIVRWHAQAFMAADVIWVLASVVLGARRPAAADHVWFLGGAGCRGYCGGAGGAEVYRLAAAAGLSVVLSVEF